MHTLHVWFRSTSSQGMAWDSIVSVAVSNAMTSWHDSTLSWYASSYWNRAVTCDVIRLIRTSLVCCCSLSESHGGYDILHPLADHETKPAPFAQSISRNQRNPFPFACAAPTAAGEPWASKSSFLMLTFWLSVCWPKNKNKQQATGQGVRSSYLRYM